MIKQKLAILFANHWVYALIHVRAKFLPVILAAMVERSNVFRLPMPLN